MFISIIEIDYLISYQLCMTWLSWSLKFHYNLRIIPHLIHTQNTLVYYSMNAYFICVVVHVQMWCVCNVMCVCSIICGSNQNDFFSFFFLFFWKWFVSPIFFKLFLCEKHVFLVFLWPISCVSSAGS